MRHQTFLVLLVIGLSGPHSFVVHGEGRGKQLRHRKCSSTDSLIPSNPPAVLTRCFLETATRFISTTWHENQPDFCNRVSSDRDVSQENNFETRHMDCQRKEQQLHHNFSKIGRTRVSACPVNRSGTIVLLKASLAILHNRQGQFP